eukprot:gb/GFBE01006659.1/.p1 GENE.gb/GFBE01006659.1/~~gb/GFBE01006659.1/.p1  ORF type:complete len:337 (+),score=65.40 gb/GFBE01006659.1/:1-1011(+)
MALLAHVGRQCHRTIYRRSPVCHMSRLNVRCCASAASKDASPPSSSGSSVRGLQLKRALPLYKSSTDLNALAEAAFKKCQMAAGMGTLGFVGVILAASSKASMPMLAGMGCLAMVNTYIILEVPKRAMRGVAMKQVERLVLLPNVAAGAADEGTSSGTAVERLRATESLEVEITSPNLIRRIRLEPTPSAWQGTRYSGLVADNRRSFADACRHLNVDVKGGECEDQELLDALLSSGHVLSEEKIEIRSDIEGLLRIPLESGTPAGASLVQVQAADEDQYEPPDFAKSTPASAIESLGTRSTFMGMAIFMLGVAGCAKRALRGEASDASSPTTPRKD